MTRQEKLKLRQKMITYKLSGHTYAQVVEKFGYSLGYVFSIMRQYKQDSQEETKVVIQSGSAKVIIQKS